MIRSESCSGIGLI